MSLLAFGAAALGVLQFHSPRPLPRAPFAALSTLAAVPSPDAFGTSREVKLRFALPGHAVEFPLAVAVDTGPLAYQWVSVDGTAPTDSARDLRGADVVAPRRPGYYRMAIIHDGRRQVVPTPVLGVMVPFADKIGATLNGYRIGTYLAERLKGPRHAPPTGFLEVRAEDAGLAVSTHFRLSDFISHDQQRDVWPKYVALNPRLLDKLELVVAKLAAARSAPADSLALGVHSGFRAPDHNARVRRAARDSRHQYGDAADVVIDADGDGRYTARDSRLVVAAVEAVEREHPELVGGLGLYTSRRYRTPYVHIDARGTRTRWRG